MSVLKKHNVQLRGQGSQAILFAHGYGCDQSMWLPVAGAFEHDYRLVLFDHLGFGGSDSSGYDAAAYAELGQYAEDVLAICEALDLHDAVFVGHSVSAMIGALASLAQPGRFSRLVLVAPSPCYLNDGAYAGGFERGDVEELLAFLDDNFVAWSSSMAPLIMGNPSRPQLAEQLHASFCRADPQAARQFARATFLSDVRARLPEVAAPALILQCRDDALAGPQVGAWVHAAMRASTLVELQASGHCPHLSAPQETAAAIRAWLE